MDLDWLVAGDAKTGVGVFTTMPIVQDTPILQFQGERVRRSQVPTQMSGAGDRYLQVGPDEYIGPSGGLDDLVNHSCDPNCAVVIEGGEVSLKSIRFIATRDEITFDYSTTITVDDRWVMRCHCGAPRCRRLIGPFARLHVSRKLYYLSVGGVPFYVLVSDGV